MLILAHGVFTPLFTEITLVKFSNGLPLLEHSGYFSDFILLNFSTVLTAITTEDVFVSYLRPYPILHFPSTLWLLLKASLLVLPLASTSKFWKVLTFFPKVALHRSNPHQG